MIIYDHTSVLQRLYQWKGTVLQETVSHVIVANLVTLAVLAFLQVDGHVLLWEDRPDWMPRPVTVQEVSPLAWQLLMLPLGFLLGLRSNQAYGRFLQGVDSFTALTRCGGELCRQASSYIKADVRTRGQDGEPNWQYRHPPAGEYPQAEDEDWRDEQKECIIRHVLAFVALVRQDIRNKRLQAPSDAEEMRARATEERWHVTQEEMNYLMQEGAYDEDINAPLIVARWLSHDISNVAHRVQVPTLIAAMEANVGLMVEADEAQQLSCWLPSNHPDAADCIAVSRSTCYARIGQTVQFHDIEKVAEHPVPWPYTHLTQFFLVIWTYSLPICLVPIYHFAAFPTISFIAIILFGMDAVAREIQDPFGFDDNDLNVQGYESKLFYIAEATLDGPLRIRVRDFAASTTHVVGEDGRRLKSHKTGDSEYMGVRELDAGLERKENIWSLGSVPWKIHGKFDDMTKEERQSANRKNNALRRIDKKGVQTSAFMNSVHESKHESNRDLSTLVFEDEDDPDSASS